MLLERNFWAWCAPGQKQTAQQWPWEMGKPFQTDAARGGSAEIAKFRRLEHDRHEHDRRLEQTQQHDHAHEEGTRGQGAVHVDPNPSEKWGGA